MRLWVFKRTRVLDGRQGFLDVEDVLAEKLIAAGHASRTFDALLTRDPPTAPFADAADSHPPVQRQQHGTRRDQHARKTRR